MPDEAKAATRDNLKRVALGLKPLKKGEAKPRKDDLDFLKLEAGQVLTDYINMGSKFTNTAPMVQGQ